MKVLLFSDLHAHNWRESAMPAMYHDRPINSRLAVALRVLRRVSTTAKAQGADAIVFAGDLFHRKKLIDISVYNEVAHALWRMARKCRLFILPGNHDLVTEWEHAVSPLRRYSNVTVIDKPTVLPELGGVGLIPYVPTRDQFLISLGACRKQGARWLIGHVGIKGAKTGSAMFQPREEVLPDDLPKDLPLFTGHYHYPQALRKTIVYIGAPVVHDRGDASSKERGAVLVDTRTLSHKRIPFTGFPDFASTQVGDYSKAKGNYVEVLAPVDADPAEVASEYYKHGAVHVTVILDRPTMKSPDRLDIHKSLGDRMPTIHELVAAYVERADTPLNKGMLLGIANRLLSEGGNAST